MAKEFPIVVYHCIVVEDIPATVWNIGQVRLPEVIVENGKKME